MSVSTACPDGVSYPKGAVTAAGLQIVYIFRFLHIGAEGKNVRYSPPLVSMGYLFQEPLQITKIHDAQVPYIQWCGVCI